MNTNLEYGSVEQIEKYQLERLRALLSFLKNDSGNEFYQQKLGDIDPSQIQSEADLAKIPFTTKSELVGEQNHYPPYGRNLSYPINNYVKLHQTSGTTGRPLKVLDTAESWDWWAQCWTQVYKGVGVTSADRIFLAFSFGPFIGFWAAYEGARELGALAIPGGGMDSEQRIAAILENEATVLCCTPSYALHLAEVATQKGIDLAASSVRVLVLAGEPGASIPAVRQRIEQAWGATCYDHAGATEVGAYGYSCQYQYGLHINEAEFIIEILDPATSLPTQPGQPGEMVLTNLGRWGYPVIRYRTSDIVKLADQACPCRRSFKLLEGGIIGRTDNMIIVRGINIFPSSVEAIIREVVEVNEFRLTFYREQNMDELAIEVELEDHESHKLEFLTALFRQRLALRIPIQAVAPGTLPRFQLKAKRVIDNRPKL